MYLYAYASNFRATTRQLSSELWLMIIIGLILQLRPFAIREARDKKAEVNLIPVENSVTSDKS